jgi:UDP-N-acetylmuramoylalanine--D-glutamate ligase
LLAPAGASFDQFSSYGQRGDAFASAVAALSR